MNAQRVPKSELQAALLVARLRDEVLRPLILSKDKNFKSNVTVLQWFHSLEKQPTLIPNRLAEVLEVPSVGEWH